MLQLCKLWDKCRLVKQIGACKNRGATSGSISVQPCHLSTTRTNTRPRNLCYPNKPPDLVGKAAESMCHVGATSFGFGLILKKKCISSQSVMLCARWWKCVSNKSITCHQYLYVTAGHLLEIPLETGYPEGVPDSMSRMLDGDMSSSQMLFQVMCTFLT